jgi:hypothetical protein
MMRLLLILVVLCSMASAAFADDKLETIDRRYLARGKEIPRLLTASSEQESEDRAKQIDRLRNDQKLSKDERTAKIKAEEAAKERVSETAKQTKNVKFIAPILTLDYNNDVNPRLTEIDMGYAGVITTGDFIPAQVTVTKIVDGENMIVSTRGDRIKELWIKQPTKGESVGGRVKLETPYAVVGIRKHDSKAYFCIAPYVPPAERVKK